MKNLLRQTVPLLAHFEHATVVVVGGEFLAQHATSFVMLLLTVIVFLILHLVKEAA